MQEKGNLSINSENFMPIIKKWLYTDKDIFIRELVSNACDAVTKLQKLSMMGEAKFMLFWIRTRKHCRLLITVSA